LALAGFSPQQHSNLVETFKTRWSSASKGGRLNACPTLSSAGVASFRGFFLGRSTALEASQDIGDGGDGSTDGRNVANGNLKQVFLGIAQPGGEPNDGCHETDFYGAPGALLALPFPFGDLALVLSRENEKTKAVVHDTENGIAAYETLAL